MVSTVMVLDFSSMRFELLGTAALLGGMGVRWGNSTVHERPADDGCRHDY